MSEISFSCPMNGMTWHGCQTKKLKIAHDDTVQPCCRSPGSFLHLLQADAQHMSHVNQLNTVNESMSGGPCLRAWLGVQTILSERPSCKCSKRDINEQQQIHANLLVHSWLALQHTQGDRTHQEVITLALSTSRTLGLTCFPSCIRQNHFNMRCNHALNMLKHCYGCYGLLNHQCRRW